MASKLLIRDGKAFIPCLIDLGSGPAEYLLPAGDSLKGFDAPTRDGLYEFNGLIAEPLQMTLRVKAGDQIEGNLCRVPEGEPGGGQWVACDGGGGGGSGGGSEKPASEKPGEKPASGKPESKETADPKTPAKKTFGERMKEAAKAVKNGAGKAAAGAKAAGTTIKAVATKARDVHDKTIAKTVAKIESKLPESWQGTIQETVASSAIANASGEAINSWNFSDMLTSQGFSGASSLLSYPVTWALAKVALLAKRGVKAAAGKFGQWREGRRQKPAESEAPKSFRYFQTWKKAYSPEEEAFFANAGQAIRESIEEMDKELGLDRKIPDAAFFAEEFRKLWEERDEGAVVLPEDTDLGPDEDELDAAVEMPGGNKPAGDKPAAGAPPAGLEKQFVFSRKEIGL